MTKRDPRYRIHVFTLYGVTKLVPEGTKAVPGYGSVTMLDIVAVQGLASKFFPHKASRQGREGRKGH